LRNELNTVIATQKTDKAGYFKFEKLEEGGNYSLFIDNNCKEKVVYLNTKKGERVGEFIKTDIGFEYKLIQSDITKLIALNETDPSEDFTASIKGRMVSVTNKIAPIKDQVVELKGADNKVLQSKKTNMQGDFEFTNIDPNAAFTIELPNYKASSKEEKVYLANSKNELVQQFARDASGKFSYKIIPADVVRLSALTESDPELSFVKQKKISDKEIIIRDFVYYNLNSFQLLSDSKPTLDKIANIISSNQGYKLEIISHTDSRGDKNENQKLSEKRSESVVAYLVTKKVDPQLLKPSGMGEGKPLNGCIDGTGCIEDEYKMNRRTEFRFYK
jgi:outer membrane protein OmpA-like peptidoglycan-associated protein